MTPELKRRRVVDDDTTPTNVPNQLERIQNDDDDEQFDDKRLSVYRILKYCLLNILIITIIVFLFFPIIFRSSFTVQQLLIFMNYVNFGLTEPVQVGLHCTRNLKVSSDESIQLGVWHIPPDESKCTLNDDQLNQIDNLFNDERMVILYVHGIGGTRSTSHRVDLYKVLSNQMHFHVITFDYRGFADSTHIWPTSDGMTNDTNAVYRWLRINYGIPSERIVVWGHSLGTAVTVRFLSSVTESIPKAAILEAPFTTIQDATIVFPITRLFKFLPWYEWCFFESLAQNPKTRFNSTALLDRVRTPLLILHAKDDGIIPFNQGKQLHQIAEQIQPTDIVRARFVSFEWDKGYGHKYIAKDPDLPSVVTNFIESVRQ